MSGLKYIVSPTIKPKPIWPYNFKSAFQTFFVFAENFDVII